MALHYDVLPINLGVDDGDYFIFQAVSDGGTVITATFGIKYLGRYEHGQISLPRLRGSPAFHPQQTVSGDRDKYVGQHPCRRHFFANQVYSAECLHRSEW